MCANFGAFIAQCMIQRKIAWRPFLKAAATADTGANSGASIPENVFNVARYMCTNFGAFIAKCTIR